MTKHELPPDIETEDSMSFEFNAEEYKQPDDFELKYTPERPDMPAIVNPTPTDDPEAPFGRNADGSPIAPYGYSKKGKVKKISGRPTEKETVKDSPDDSAKLLSDIAEAKKESTPETVVAPPEKKEFKVYINGAMFLLALDFVFPGVIAMAYNFFNDEKVDRNDLCMTEDERKEMQPLADDVVQELLKGLSPLQQFLIYTGVMYGTKLTFAPKGKGKKK